MNKKDNQALKKIPKIKNTKKNSLLRKIRSKYKGKHV